MVNYVLKKMARIHCARGPMRCEKCKAYAKKKKWAILDIAPSNHPEAARPVIEIEIEGEKAFQTFDVLKYFDKKKEAKAYAKENDITIDLEIAKD